MVATRSLVRFAAVISLLALQACGGGGDEKPAGDTTPPTILSTSPASGATGVLRNASVVVTFSEPVAAASVTASTVTWTQGATPVAFGIAVSGATVTLTPTGTLANSASHTVTVTTGVTDVAGNALAAPASFDFTTRDDVAPTIAGTVPADGATAVSRSSTFTITFSEPIAAATADASTITWTQGATPVDFAIGVSGAVVTLTPAGTLAAGAVHTVAVSTGVTDAQGNAIAAPASWTFTTLDDVAPTLVSTSPVNGATGVARSTAFAITFSEPMALGTLTGNVELFQGGTPVAVAISQSGSTVTLTPATLPLANFAPFTVQVATDVQDLAGNNLATGATFTFTTIDDVAPAFAAPPTDGGAYTASTAVHFSWTAATDAGAGLAASPYWLEARTAPGGGMLLFDASVGTALGADVTAAHGQTVYANVKAIDAAGNETWSGWSDGITVDGAPPIAPNSVASATGAWIEDSVQFTWTPGVDATSGVAFERFEVSSTTADDGSGVILGVDDATPGSYTYDTSWAPDGTVLYARVRTHDLAGNTSDWSPWSSAVTVDRVGPVFASGPTDDGTWSAKMLTIGFGAAADAGSGRVGRYTVHLSSLGEWDPIYEYGTVDVDGPPAVIDVTTLGVGDAQQVFARVSAVDAIGNVGTTSWSNGITVDLSGPETPATPTDDGPYATAATVVGYWGFTYDTWSGTAQYRVRASTEAGTGGVFFDQTFAADVFSTPVTGANGDTIYFQVQAIDAVGNLSDESSWSDGILIDLAAAPVAAAPTPDVTRTNGPLLWDWTPVTDPESGTREYEIQLSASAGEGGVWATVGAGTAPPFGMNVSARPDGSQVFARVRAYDLAGNVSGWTGWSVGVDVDTSGPIFASAPTDDGAFSLPDVYFYWSDPTDPAGVDTGSFLLQIATSPDPIDVFWTTPGALSGDAYDVSTYMDGTTFYARVIALDLLGNSTESGWSDGVTIDRLPPPTPAAPGTPGTQQRETSILFSWVPTGDDTSITTNVSGLRDYTLAVRDDLGTTWSYIVADTSYPFTGGVNGRTYSAQLKAYDLAGLTRDTSNSSPFGAWSSGVTVNTNAPGTPGVPADDGVFSADAVLAFTWTDAAGTGITGYQVQISAGAAHDPVGAATCDNVGTALSANCDVAPGGLPNGTTYFARVRARDAVDFGGWSAWSDGILVDTTPPSAPGTPTDNGPFDNTSVRFDWTEATDAESGILTYEAEIFANGIYVLTSFGWVPYTTFDATGREGQNITAHVRAHNFAGTPGPWSGDSDGVVVETQGPMVTNRTPGPGWPTIATNQDFVFQFSEPMDVASVESALSLTCGTGCPKNGLIFVWRADLMQVTVIPDAVDPVGATNVDLLPERTAVHVVIGSGATDLAGNALQSDPQNDYTLMTGDETAPQLVSLTVDGDASPVAPAAVQGGFTLVATFDEPMSPTRGGIRIETAQGGIEARYDSSANVQSATANSPSAGQATYLLWGCPDIRVGDVVTVEWANPADFNVVRAAVSAVGSDGMGNCAFTVPNATSAGWTGGGQVYFPSHWSDTTIAWTGPTTLAITLPPWFSLPAGSDTRVTVSNASDAGGMWMWAESTLQVSSLPATDLVDPAILSAVPLPGSTGVSRTLPVFLRFSEPMDAASLAGSWAADAAGNTYEMRYSSDEMGPVVMFMPRAAPAGGTLVRVHVPGTAADLAGRTLGADVDYAFDVADRTDFDPPVLYESLPTNGDPVDQVNQASAIFADAATGMLEMLDAGSVGNEDVLVTDVDTGLLVRGFRVSVEGADGTLQLQSPPRSSGFSTGWGGQSIQTATATGGVATYTTWGPHGLKPGWQVEVQVQWMDNGCFNTTAVLAAVLSDTTFTLPTGCPDTSVGNNGWANWQTPRTLFVELAVPPGAGGTGILDFERNPMDPGGFTALMTPRGSNRFPLVESLRDLRIGVTTGPLGRQLSAYFRVRDPDNDGVTATVTALHGAVSFTGATRVLTNTEWGAEYRFGNDGPPMGASPPEMDDANFPTSDYYPFEVTLDDGNGGVTTHVRRVWVWAPVDVPQVDAIDDGGTLRLVDATRPIVVENSASPVLHWSNVDLANADFMGLQYLELIARNVVGDGGGPSALLLDKTVTSAPFPTPLEPSFYAWFATELKFSPGGTNMDTQGWSIDFSRLTESTFVYGPDNRAYAGREFGAARAHVVRETRDGFGAITAPATAWDATGLYAVEGLPAGGTAPVEVAQSLTRNDGALLSQGAYFGAAADGGFMMTTTEPSMGLPLAARGIVGRGGRFFALAGEGVQDASIELGAYRDPAIDFSGGVSGTTFSFVQLGIGYDATGVVGVEGMVGTAVAGPATLAVSGIANSGDPNPPTGSFDIPYTVGLDGFMRLDIEPFTTPDTNFVSGYLGGAPGALVGALAQDVDPAPDKTFLLLIAQQYAWSGGETEALLDGAYPFVEHGVTVSGGALADLYSVHGTLDFDGLGGFTFFVVTPSGPMAGGGTYAVDAGSGLVAVSPDAASGGGSYLMRLGPDADTAFGVSTASADQVKVLVMSR